LYWKPEIIPDLKQMSGEEFKNKMNIKVGKKMQENAFLEIMYESSSRKII